jgi:CHAT domain
VIQRRPAVLHLSIEIGDKTRIILNKTEESQPFDKTFNFSRGQLEDIHAMIRSDLDEFQRELGRPQQISITKVARLLLKLQKRGRSVMYSLFDDDNDSIHYIVSAFNRVCNSWNGPGWRPGDLNPPLITVGLTPGCGIPIEILPLAIWRTPPDDEGDLLKLASSFLGFSAIVQREGLGTPVEADALGLTGDPRLPIRLFMTRDLGGPLADEQYFVTNPLIELDRTWPGTRGSPQETVCVELADLLWHTSRKQDESQPAVQICHFACHCDTEDNYSGRYKIIFKSRMGFTTQVVMLEDLRDELMRLSEIYGIKGRKSLLIMNACGSAGLRPGSASSFPKLFLSKDIGFLGFVGTETTISDGFASLFAQSLYNNMLSASRIPLGLAMHMARWEMLEKFNNPLGIIYSLYADPEIQVVRN